MDKKRKVIITVGLPASGKSTFARSWVAEEPANRVQVEKDEIRKDTRLFKNGVYNFKRGDEVIVVAERNRLIEKALSEGKDVISSDTNLVNKHTTCITQIANRYNADIEIKSFLDVPLKELIERDANRDDSVGEQVIRKMFHQHVKTMPTFVEWNNDLETAILFDLDGTLAHMNGRRSPYDWKKVGLDDVELALTHIIDGINLIKYAKVIILSGRDSVCRLETEEWLDKNCIYYDELLMRAENDSRDDTIVKSELYEQHIRGNYNVLCVFDDRKKVCDMWRDVYGFRVFQSGDPNYSF